MRRLIRSKVLCPILFLPQELMKMMIPRVAFAGMIIVLRRNHLVFGVEARIVTNIKREERHQQKTEYRFMDEMLIDYSEK